jgi:hypothetical protein
VVTVGRVDGRRQGHILSNVHRDRDGFASSNRRLAAVFAAWTIPR